MKRSFLVLVAVAVAIGAFGALLVVTHPALAKAPLSPDEAADLQFVREEEKLARDVYEELDALYGGQVAIFGNIAVSEDTHTLAIKTLLDRYDVTDPAADDDHGVFVNHELQLLYDDLVESGSASLREGLLVGVFIEELDIEDLTACLDDTTHADIQNVYTSLIDGSLSHLDSFQKVLAR